LLKISIFELANSTKAHLRIFPSLVMYPGQSHVFPVSPNQLSPLTISRTAGSNSIVVLSACPSQHLQPLPI
jgi:hypothetical protein